MRGLLTVLGPASLVLSIQCSWFPIPVPDSAATVGCLNWYFETSRYFALPTALPWLEFGGPFLCDSILGFGAFIEIRGRLGGNWENFLKLYTSTRREIQYLDMASRVAARGLHISKVQKAPCHVAAGSCSPGRPKEWPEQSANRIQANRHE